MFDTSFPILVRTCATYHPVTNHWTGYIFRLYEPTATEFRELFFSTIREALLFAKACKWACSLDGSMVPARIYAHDLPTTVETIDYTPHVTENDDVETDTASGNIWTMNEARA